MCKFYFLKNESRKTGLIDNFWMKRRNFMKHENMKVNITAHHYLVMEYRSVVLVIIFRDKKQSYENRKQERLDVEEKILTKSRVQLSNVMPFSRPNGIIRWMRILIPDKLQF